MKAKQELLKLATKNLIVNKEVAKLAATKTMTRRLKTNLKVGDVFWLREPARVTNYTSRFEGVNIDYQLIADNKKEYRIELPIRFFPNVKDWIKECKSVPNGCIKEMARHFYEVVSVHRERLQEISEEDCLKEGIFEIEDNDCTGNYKVYTINPPIIQNGMILNEKYNSSYEAFEQLWNSTAKAPNGWDNNPMIEVIEYKELKYAN